MKKLILISIALLLVSGAVSAQPVGYIGLFIDEDRTSSCVTGVGFYPVEIWISCLPNPATGMLCAEFMLTYPPNVIQSTSTTTPLMCVTLGTIDTGMSACLCECAWSWTWLFHQMLYVTDPTPTEINIVKHPDPYVQCVQFANCDAGYPLECVKVFTKFLINQECPPENPIGTERTSWGAIKGLYKK